MLFGVMVPFYLNNFLRSLSLQNFGKASTHSTNMLNEIELLTKKLDRLSIYLRYIRKIEVPIYP